MGTTVIHKCTAILPLPPLLDACGGNRDLDEESEEFSSWTKVAMGNKPVKEKREEILVRAPPPLDPAFIRWLTKDVERVYGFAPKNPHAIKPPDQYIEYMRSQGLLDLDLNDPDLACLFK